MAAGLATPRLVLFACIYYGGVLLQEVLCCGGLVMNDMMHCMFHVSSRVGYNFIVIVVADCGCDPAGGSAENVSYNNIQ